MALDALRRADLIVAGPGSRYTSHLGFQPFDHLIFNTAPVPAHLAARYAERRSVPITVTAGDLAALQDLDVQALGASLACEGPPGRIRHHPGRLAAAATACARFDRRANAMRLR